MGNRRILKPHEVVSRLTALGFVEVRQRGSLKQIRHADGRATIVPMHQGRDVAPIILKQIATDIGLTIDELVASGD